MKAIKRWIFFSGMWLLIILTTSTLVQSQPLTKKDVSNLQEKPYLHTDKPYYYPGEKVWFKAYMNYRSPERMDSLSKTLYVELISPDRKIIQTRIIFIDGGSGAGSIPLPESLAGGNYFLRAYTRWMLNFDNREIFVKPLWVLNWNERPEAVAGSIKTSATPGLTFNTDRASFRLRQRIRLGMELRDKDGKPVAADLSVSITDLSRVIEVPDKNILDDFGFTTPAITTTSFRHPVESGISLQGKYESNDSKAEKISFVAVENNFASTRPVELDAQGNFFTGGFQFYDSASIGFQITGKKKKANGQMTLSERPIPEMPTVRETIPFKIVEDSTIVKKKTQQANTHDAILLKEVVVTDERTKLNKEVVPNTYAKADFSISGDEIVKSSRTSLIDALRGRVPGLVVVDGFLRLGNQSNFMGAASTEPLLIVDGVQMTRGAGDSNYGRLMQINPEIVERVDVIKYGGAAIYGSRGANGAIIVTTKSGEFGTGKDATGQSGFISVFKITGFARPETFSSPDYSKANPEGVEDARSTLYWNPDVVTDAITGRVNVIFYSADLPGRYKVVVEGVTAAGEPVRGVYYLTITP
jgi:TonB-dependent SusC/RagA subfamily outer membrane receptor